jgi:hypothetical protein
MSQSFWEAGETEKATLAPAESIEAAETGSLAVSANDFAALEERILRAVELVQEARRARAAAEERAAKAEAALQEQGPQFERLQAELDRMKAERVEVRERAERLLNRLDALEL